MTSVGIEDDWGSAPPIVVVESEAKQAWLDVTAAFVTLWNHPLSWRLMLKHLHGEVNWRFRDRAMSEAAAFLLNCEGVDFDRDVPLPMVHMRDHVAISTAYAQWQYYRNRLWRKLYRFLSWVERQRDQECLQAFDRLHTISWRYA